MDAVGVFRRSDRWQVAPQIAGWLLRKLELAADFFPERFHVARKS